MLNRFVDVYVLIACTNTGERFIRPGDKSSEAGYHAVVSTLLKAVPKVMRAKPGILKPMGTPIHWLPDLRGL